MPRIIFPCLCLTLFTASVLRPAQVSIPSAAASPGSSVIVPITYSAQNEVLAGLQFDLYYDDAVLGIETTAGEAVRNSGKSVSIFDLAPNVKRVLITGLNQNPIASGALMNAFLNVKSRADVATYQLTVLRSAGVRPDGSSVPLASGSGEISIQTGQAVPLQTGGIVSAASFLAGPLAPGEIVTLIGSAIGPEPAVVQDRPGSVDLSDARVLFNGIPAPLLYASPSQMNVVVPYAVPSSGTLPVEVQARGTTVAKVVVPMTTATPALFTLNGSGTGQGAILNQDYGVNDAAHPAERGSYVMLYGTGAGNTDPPGIDGVASMLASPLLPVTVLIGGVNAPVIYAGTAPPSISGLLQVNCRVPENAPAGTSVPVFIQMGSLSSQAGVTIAIK